MITLPTSAHPVLILNDCALSALRQLPADSVDCIITSPPYWGLRDYKIAPTSWPACSYAPMPGLPPIRVKAETSCLGLEKTLHAFLAHLTLIFEECRRVLKPTGSTWVNMGDSYASDAGGYSETGSRGATSHKAISRGTQSAVIQGRTRKPQHGLKPKDLIGQPWRVAFALQAGGWYLRQDNIWHKPNPMPESIRDRATKSHEYFFHLTKSERYFFDLTAWAERVTHPSVVRLSQNVQEQLGSGRAHGGAKANGPMKAVSRRNSFARTTKDSAGEHGQKPQFREDRPLVDYSGTRNKRSVWTVPTVAYTDAHYATYPPKLITPPLLASTSAKGCCPTCGSPWERKVEKQIPPRVQRAAPKSRMEGNDSLSAVAREKGDYMNGPELAAWRADNPSSSVWRPTCPCEVAPPVPAIVLDIFGGSGTTAQEALNNGRHAILIERGPHNIELIHKRLAPYLQSPVLSLA